MFIFGSLLTLYSCFWWFHPPFCTPFPLTAVTTKSLPRLPPDLHVCILVPCFCCLCWWLSVLPTNLETQSHFWQRSLFTSKNRLYTLSLLSRLQAQL